jgi:hypothetical protein
MGAISTFIFILILFDADGLPVAARSVHPRHAHLEKEEHERAFSSQSLVFRDTSNITLHQGFIIHFLLFGLSIIERMGGQHTVRPEKSWGLFRCVWPRYRDQVIA